MKPYPELHAKMQQDKDRSVTQAARLDELLARHSTSKSFAKKAVSGAAATVAGFAHVAASDEVLQNVLAAVGFNAYEIGSYKVLLALAEAAGAAEDKVVLEQSMKDEQQRAARLAASSAVISLESRRKATTSRKLAASGRQHVGLDCYAVPMLSSPQLQHTFIRQSAEVEVAAWAGHRTHTQRRALMPYVSQFRLSTPDRYDSADRFMD